MFKNLIFILLSVVLFFGCQSKEEKEKMDKEAEIKKIETEYKVAIKNFLMESLNDPKSYEEISWHKLKASDLEKFKNKNILIINHKFRAKNAFGGVVPNNYLFLFQNGQAQLLFQKDIKESFVKFLDAKSPGATHFFTGIGVSPGQLKHDYLRSFEQDLKKKEVLSFLYETPSSPIQFVEHANKSFSGSPDGEELSLLYSVILFLPEVVEELLYGTLSKFHTQDIKSSTPSSFSSSSEDGSLVYKSKCFSCHGPRASKQALNKSAIIAGWSKERIINALNGYKDGTYGGPMKSVMKPIANGLSETDIKGVAEIIESFK